MCREGEGVVCFQWDRTLCFESEEGLCLEGEQEVPCEGGVLKAGGRDVVLGEWEAVTCEGKDAMWCVSLSHCTAPFTTTCPLALTTHRLLPPSMWLGEAFGRAQEGWGYWPECYEKEEADCVL